MSKKSNNSIVPIKWTLFAAIFGCLIYLSSFPIPIQLQNATFGDRLRVKSVFYFQALQHMLGLRNEYDLKYLHDMYQDILLPNETKSFKHLPKFRKLREIDGSNPNWQQEFKHYFVNQLGKSAEPIVIRGLVHNEKKLFPGVSNWNLDYFRDHMYGKAEIPVFTNISFDKSAVMMPFDEFVRDMNDETKYRYAKAIPDISGKIRAGLPANFIASLLGKSLEHKFQTAMDGGSCAEGHVAFVGGKQSKTRLHCDFGTSTFFQIQGRKRWIFFPPSETMFLFPTPHALNVAYNAAIDIFNPDFEKFPMYGAAKGLEVVLQPGDVMFFPAFWWHGVENLDDITIGVDLAVMDFTSSMVTNTPLSIGSFFNPKILLNVIYGRLFHGGEDAVRNLFFNGYMMGN